jgi:hypothetical protein
MITVMIPIAVIKSILMVLVKPRSKIRSESRGRRSCKNKAVFIGATMKYKKNTQSIPKIANPGDSRHITKAALGFPDGLSFGHPSVILRSSFGHFILTKNCKTKEPRNKYLVFVCLFFHYAQQSPQISPHV